MTVNSMGAYAVPVLFYLLNKIGRIYASLSNRTETGCGLPMLPYLPGVHTGPDKDRNIRTGGSSGLFFTLLSALTQISAPHIVGWTATPLESGGWPILGPEAAMAAPLGRF